MKKAMRDFRGQKLGEINLKKKSTMIFLQLASLPIMVAAVAGISKLTIIFRAGGIQISHAGLLTTLILLFVMILAHEMLHGLCFWFYTGERPKFGFKIFYAYATAPGWCFPRQQFIIVVLCPLIVITCVGIVLLPFIPSMMVISLIIVIAANIVGSIGDMYITCKMLFFPKDVIVEDLKSGVAFFRP